MITALHLDLKGVPPTAERLVQLLPVFAAAGYNALVVEWEDMFPWTVNKKFRCETAYSAEQVASFHAAAKKLNLEIIPLVQCLGHMETPLREPEYAHLREVPHKSDVLNPLAKGARELVEKMIDDVLALTPNLRYFHLGGDEAWTFGTHPDTKAYIEKHGKGALYLHHVEPLLDKLLAKNIRPILWHDMMNHWDSPALTALAKKADLCVWGYRGTHAQTQSHWQPKYIQRFADHGIKLWGATAYKGGDSESGDLPIPEMRQVNCQSWADVGRQFNMVGVLATAWSRYSTERMQKSPIDSSLDVLILCGHILRDGKPPADGLAHARTLLEKLGERQRFDACYAAMKQLTDARKDFWLALQHGREAIATCTDDPRRRFAGTLSKYLDRMENNLRLAQDAAEKTRTAFAGLIAPIWLDRYLSERITPMQEEIALLHPKIQSLEPEAYAADRKAET